MKKVLITLNSFQPEEVLKKGQSSFLPLIAQSGAYGAEIRRELFPDDPRSLKELGNQLKEAGLSSVYSAPVGLFIGSGSLNRAAIALTILEAVAIGASIVKFSLGHYDMQARRVAELKELLDLLDVDDRLQITIENDQTKHGGSLAKIQHFLAECKQQGLPVRMTFDIGNWAFTGEDVSSAAKVLSEFVVYLHLKTVDDQLATLPLSKDNFAEWRDLLQYFSNDIPRAIEFPLAGGEEAAAYTSLLSHV